MTLEDLTTLQKLVGGLFATALFFVGLGVALQKRILGRLDRHDKKLDLVNDKIDRESKRNCAHHKLMFDKAGISHREVLRAEREAGLAGDV